MKRESGFTPAALLSRPKVTPIEVYYLDVFYDLTTARQIHMGGVGPIPISEVLAYMQMLDIQGVENRRRLLRVLQHLDSAYLQYQAEQGKRKVSKED